MSVKGTKEDIDWDYLKKVGVYDKACPYCGAYGGNNKGHIDVCAASPLNKYAVYPSTTTVGTYTIPPPELTPDMVQKIVRVELERMIPILLEKWWESKL
jgi:hypothetical protein